MEAFDHVRARHLEEVLALALFEDVALELDKVVRDEQRDQNVVVRVQRDVERHSVVEQHHRVQHDVHERNHKVEDKAALPAARLVSGLEE